MEIIKDKDTFVSDCVHLYDNDVNEGRTTDHIFIKEDPNGNLVDDFCKKYHEIWKTPEVFYFYIAKRKKDGIVGTMICECEYNFEYIHSGYDLIRDLNKGVSRTRTNNQEQSN